jgi:hypothetical protein
LLPHSLLEERPVDISTAKYCKETRETPLQFNQKTNWQGISTGLSLVVWGYGILVAGATLGLALLWHVAAKVPLFPWLAPSPENRGLFVLLSVLVLGLTAVLSYGLVLTGLWRCLMNASQQQKSKKFVFVCLNTLLLAAILNVAGVCLDGGRTYTALHRGGEELATFDACSAGNLLHAGGLALGLFSSLIFSQFLRNVAGCFRARSEIQSVDMNLAFVGLMLGGSVGTMFWAYRLAFRPEILPWILGVWLACVVWHLVLVSGVRGCVVDGLRGCVEDGLRDLPAPQPEPAPLSLPGAITLHTLSGLRRLANKAN